MTALRTHDFSNLNRNRMFGVPAQGTENTLFFVPQAVRAGAPIPYFLNQQVKP